MDYVHAMEGLVAIMQAIMQASAFVPHGMHKGVFFMDQKNCPARWLPCKTSNDQLIRNDETGQFFLTLNDLKVI